MFMQIHDEPKAHRHTGAIEVEIGGTVYGGQFEIKGKSIEVSSIDLGTKNIEMTGVVPPELIAKLLLVMLAKSAQSSGR